MFSPYSHLTIFFVNTHLPKPVTIAHTFLVNIDYVSKHKHTDYIIVFVGSDIQTLWRQYSHGLLSKHQLIIL